MRSASFIFNWISNINLLSFTGPFMSSSLPSKLLQRGIKGFAWPLHYSSSPITHPQPARSNKTGMKILQKIHLLRVLIHFPLGETPFNFFPHFAWKKKRTFRDESAVMLQTACKIYVPILRASAAVASQGSKVQLAAWKQDVFRLVAGNTAEAAEKRTVFKSLVPLCGLFVFLISIILKSQFVHNKQQLNLSSH